MGKAAKSRRAEDRKKEKRFRKEQSRLLYESYRDQGRNTKSHRKSINEKRKRKVRITRHSTGPCNNIACQREGCNGVELPKKEVFPKATKPWKTSAEKLAHYNQKLLSERGSQIELTSEEAKERLLNLDEKLGVGLGASKERVRLAQLAA